MAEPRDRSPAQSKQQTSNPSLDPEPIRKTSVPLSMQPFRTSATLHFMPQHVPSPNSATTDAPLQAQNHTPPFTRVVLAMGPGQRPPDPAVCHREAPLVHTLARAEDRTPSPAPAWRPPFSIRHSAAPRLRERGRSKASGARSGLTGAATRCPKAGCCRAGGWFGATVCF